MFLSAAVLLGTSGIDPRLEVCAYRDFKSWNRGAMTAVVAYRSRKMTQQESQPLYPPSLPVAIDLAATVLSEWQSKAYLGIITKLPSAIPDGQLTVTRLT